MTNRWSAWSKGLVLGTAMLLVLAACGGDDPTATPTAPPAPTSTPTAVPTPTATLLPGVPTPTPAPATATPTAPAATPTPSFDAEAYFKGKTIRIMANSNPGGGTDSQGRVMSAFIGKSIPGNPRVIFSNNGNKPLEYLFSATQAPKDGTYISWNSTPQLNFGFEEDTQYIKRSSFQFLGATIDGTRSWMTFDPVGNLGAEAADKCLWDFAGSPTTGTGKHGAFYLADEISDVAEGAPGFVANAYASEQLGVPFKYFAFDTVDTNAIYTMWARGDINTTVRGSLWYRFPTEHPDWIPNGLMRVYAGMGPGELGPSGGIDAHCPNISSHFETDLQRDTFEAIMNPPNYLSKSLWLPPGTPDNIADALSSSFERAFANDPALVAKYGAVAGEVPRWTDRATGTASTLANENIFEASLAITKVEGDRLIEKYFPNYVN